MSVHPLDELNLRSRIQECLNEFIQAQTPLLATISTETLPLVESLTQLLDGGKRLRPAFAYWGYRSTGAHDTHEIVKACSALEFLQACALIHDDVMDNSDTRRGKPAVHKQFEARHLANSWFGDSQAFGSGAAILVGDLALSWADDLLMKSGLSEHQLSQAKDIYDTMRTELMAGQYLDLLEQVKRDACVERANTVIRFKSAKYTIERPLHMGAAIAGADSQHMQALSEYGLALGEAFQLRDDLLGVFGDAELTGKPAGDDLREHKQTVLLAYALADQTLGDQIRAILTTSRLTSEDVALLQQMIQDTGAASKVESTITRQTESALAALEHASIDATAREALTQLAFMATQRQA